VVRANPAEYVEKYGSTLVTEMPDFVREIATPAEVGVLAAEYRPRSLVELEGELEGFKYIDLDKEGLGEYRYYLSNLGEFLFELEFVCFRGFKEKRVFLLLEEICSITVRCAKDFECKMGFGFFFQGFQIKNLFSSDDVSTLCFKKSQITLFQKNPEKSYFLKIFSVNLLEMI